MILNLGWDPLATALVIGAMTCVLPTAFFEMWRRHSVAQALNAAIIFALSVLGWGFTSQPFFPMLIATMFLVAYGLNQLLDNLIIGVLTARRAHKTGGPVPSAKVAWKDLK